MSMNKYCKECEQITYHFYKTHGKIVNEICSKCRKDESIGEQT